MATVKISSYGNRFGSYRVRKVFVAWQTSESRPVLRVTKFERTVKPRWDEDSEVVHLEVNDGVKVFTEAVDLTGGPSDWHAWRRLQEPTEDEVFEGPVLQQEDDALDQHREASVKDAVELLSQLLSRRRAKALEKAVFWPMNNEVRMNILRSVTRRLGVADQVEVPQEGSAKWEVYAIARAMGWSPAVPEPRAVDGYVVRPGWTYEVFDLDDLTKGVEKDVTVIDDVKNNTYSYTVHQS